MARVTAEDCVEKIPNRFELVLVAAQRARDISQGSLLTIDRDNDKNPVVALREIADSTIDLDDVRESLVRNHQRMPSMEEMEDELVELMDGEQDFTMPVIAEGTPPEAVPISMPEPDATDEDGGPL